MSKLRVPWVGWIWLAMVAVLLTIGLVRRINLLTLMACPLLVVWFVNVWLANRQIRRLRGRRRIDEPIFAQSPARISLEVVNTRRAPCRGIRVEHAGPAHALARFTQCLAGRETTAFRETVTLPERGRYAWGPLWAWSGHPFGLALRGVRLVEGAESIVLPPVGRLHRGKLRQFLARGTPAMEPIRRAARRRVEAEADFHGLRAFRAGDSPRWIHWRTTARRGELMVREFEDAPGEHFILVLDCRVPAGNVQAGARSPLLEEAIRFAATICWEYRLQQGNRFVLGVAGAKPIIMNGATGWSHSLDLLECLALQEAQTDYDGAAIVEALAETALPSAPMLLVQAGATRLENLLARALDRPVVAVSAPDVAHLDFYEGPKV
jgi:uncharacterized protein (DUF58 family)